MLNIRTRAVAETLTFQLCDAADEPLVNENGTPCNATIYGPGSRRYAAAQAAKQSKMLGRLQRGKDITLSADEAARQNAEFLASITESLDVAYDELEGREKLLAIYADPALGFVADQVAKKAGDWANFSRGSVPS